MQRKRVWRNRAAALAAALFFACGAAAGAQEGEMTAQNSTLPGAGEIQSEASSANAANGWRLWDEPEAEAEQERRLPEELTEKAAAWKARLENAAAVRSGEQVGESEPQTGNQESEPQTGSQESEPQTGSPEGEPQTETEAVEQSEKETGAYIFPDVAARYLTEAEVQALSLQAACYAKNEIYARHGRRFVSQELQEYFGEKPWYEGTVAPESFSDTVFNEFERANLLLIQSWEFTLNANGYSLDQPGYDIHSF